jgi:hypothetical protein
MKSSEENVFICENCSKSIPLTNKLIHSARCSAHRKRSANPLREDIEVIDLLSPPRRNSIEDSEGHLDDATYREISSDPIIEEDNEWQCRACTYNNNHSSTRCIVCDTPRFVEEEEEEEVSMPLQEYERDQEEEDDHNPGVDRSNFNPYFHSHGTNTTHHHNNSTVKWACSRCTFENSRQSNQCDMCSSVRPPQTPIRQRLIDEFEESDSDGPFHRSQRMRHQNHPIHSTSTYVDTAFDSAILGAGLGAGTAWINGRSLSRGAMEGAGIGMLSGVLLRALADEMRTDSNGFGDDMIFGNMTNGMMREEPNAPQGVPRSTLNQLPSRIFHSSRDKADQCSICIENFRTGDKVRTLPCLHQFHEICVDHWLRSKNTCPICKHTING